jgi:DNA-binding NarL/FixJ family response regulator
MRLVVADDLAIVRDGLSHLLEARGYEVATARNVDELLAAVEGTRPDVALIDIRMPSTHPTEDLVAASTIRDHMPEVGVLVLSQHADAESAFALLRERPGRSGYLLRNRVTQVDTLVDAINRVARGETVVDRELVDLLLRSPAARDHLALLLTHREREVLALVAEGLSDGAIAERLWLSITTVETHVRHIMAKLDLPADTPHDRRVLAVLAYLRESSNEPWAGG